MAPTKNKVAKMEYQPQQETLEVVQPPPTSLEIQQEPQQLIQSVPTNGLRTREDRMLDEKIIFLNKSTTKYLIIGVEPITFNAKVCICDRATGTHISMTGPDFLHFMSEIQNKATGFHADCPIQSAVRVNIENNLWWITSLDQTIVLHRISIDNIIRFGYILYCAVKKRLNEASLYQTIVNEYKTKTAGMDFDKTYELLLNSFRQKTDGELEHTILQDLICNLAYLGVDEYNKKILGSE